MKTKIKRTILTKLACLTALCGCLIGSTLTVSAEETTPAAPAGYTYNRADGTAEWREGAVPAVGDNGLPVYIRTRTDGNIAVAEMSGVTPGGVPVYGYWYDIYTPNQVALLYNAIDAAGITNEMSQYDKCVAINNYVCSAFVYDSRDNMYPDGLITLQGTRHAVCSNYADLYRTMCEAIGINCKLAEGITPNPDTGEMNMSHAWDAVFIDGKVYYVDPTWNDSETPNRYLMSETLWPDHVFEYYREDNISEADIAIQEIMKMFKEDWTPDSWLNPVNSPEAQAQMEADINAMIVKYGGIPREGIVINEWH